MAMDVLRVGRVQTARFYPNDPGRLTSIRWYKCKPDALIFPHPHAFGFNVWDDPEVREGRAIGFTPGLGSWNNGLNHGEAGQHFHGQPDWFLFGIPDSAADVDGRCLQWAGQFIPALGFVAVGGAAAASGAAALGFAARSVEGASAVSAALGIAARWVDLTPPARGALAFAAAAVARTWETAAAAVGVASHWTEVIRAAASLGLASAGVETDLFAARIGLGAAWVEHAGGFAPEVGLAATWGEKIVAVAGQAGADNLVIVATVVNGLPFSNVVYDSTRGFDPVGQPYAWVAQAAGVYTWSLGIQYARSGAVPSAGENVEVIVLRGANPIAGHTSNPPEPLADGETWQAYLIGQANMQIGEIFQLHLYWTQPGAGSLAVNYRFFVEYLGPLGATPAAAAALTP
jgi:hypothetical protein